MENLGYYNGVFGPLDEMSIPMNDRVCWFGDGVYDAGPARNGVIFAMDEHVDRFFRSAAAVDINIPCSQQELKALLNELITKVEGHEHFVYYQVTRGSMVRKHDYPEDMQSNLWVMIKPQVMPDGRTRIQLRSEEDTRFFHCDVKTLNLLPSVLSSQAAKREGVFETVYWRPMDGRKRVTECAHCNVSVLRGGELWTAPLDKLILPGIARAHLIKACNALGIPVHEEPYCLEDVFSAEEVLVTSSSNLVLFADALDGTPVGGKRPELAEAIRAEIHREFSEYTAR